MLKKVMFILVVLAIFIASPCFGNVSNASDSTKVVADPYNADDYIICLDQSTFMEEEIAISKKYLLALKACGKEKIELLTELSNITKKLSKKNNKVLSSMECLKVYIHPEFKEFLIIQNARLQNWANEIQKELDKTNNDIDIVYPFSGH